LLVAAALMMPQCFRKIMGVRIYKGQYKSKILKLEGKGTLPKEDSG
jgi:hypothetical protein